MIMRLAGIHQYPIKSCTGFSPESETVLDRGFPHDRRFMLVDENGRFISQREQPRLSLVVPVVQNGLLQIAAPEQQTIQLSLEPGLNRHISVTIWSSTVNALDMGDEVADWFSIYLGATTRLVHMPDSVQRLRKSQVNGAEFEVSFADGYPYLLTNTASLQELNNRLASPVPMDRFRANLVVDTDLPFAEDDWKQISIGAVTFDVVKPCARCTITTIEQETAIKTQEPLRTLNTFRRFGNQVNFGMNLIARTNAEVSLGDPVTILD